MGPIAPAIPRQRMTALEREIHDYATVYGGFTVTMTADGKVWLIDEFGRRNLIAAVKGLVIKRIAEPVGLPKPTGKEPGEVRQTFRLL